MTTENIFADQANNVAQADASTTQQTNQPVFTIPTEAVDYVGDGKKYKSVEDALKSVPHAQKHIQTLEDELRVTKEELQRRKTAEELLNEMKQGYQPQQPNTTGVDIDPDALSGIVERVIEKKANERQAIDNATKVTSKFTEVYGAKAEEMYNKIAQDAGLSVPQLNQLALSSPNAVLKLAGLSQNTQSNVGKIQSDFVSSPINNTQNQFNTTVKPGASTKDIMAAFNEAKRKVETQLSKG